MPEEGLFNTVIVANNLNPSIFSQLWLVKNGVFAETEFDQSKPLIFTPMAVNVATRELELMVLPQMLQATFVQKNVDYERLLKKTLGTIANLLPHTPYQAVGFNLIWNLRPKDPVEYKKIDRAIFLSKDNPLHKSFGEDNCRFGGYFSKDVSMGRLRLNIAPVTLPFSKETTPIEGLQLTFNFNHDLTEQNRAGEIFNFLGYWSSAHKMAQEMVADVGKGWSE